MFTDYVLYNIYGSNMSSDICMSWNGIKYYMFAVRIERIILFYHINWLRYWLFIWLASLIHVHVSAVPQKHLKHVQYNFVIFVWSISMFCDVLLCSSILSAVKSSTVKLIWIFRCYADISFSNYGSIHNSGDTYIWVSFMAQIYYLRSTLIDVWACLPISWCYLPSASFFSDRWEYIIDTYIQPMSPEKYDMEEINKKRIISALWHLSCIYLYVKSNAVRFKYMQEGRTSWLSGLQARLLLLFLRSRAGGILKKYYPTVCVSSSVYLF
jgi:hypothetical protein